VVELGELGNGFDRGLPGAHGKPAHEHGVVHVLACKGDRAVSSNNGGHSPVFKVGRHAAIGQSSRNNKRGDRVRFQANAKRFSSTFELSRPRRRRGSARAKG
jgi:hypothetical protein